jgi:phage tail-like protein
MNGDRGYSLLVQPEQWARCAHSGTALLAGGGVELTWADDDTAGTAGKCAPAEVPVPAPCGLAFDQHCQAYRSRPESGLVQVQPWDIPGAQASCSAGLRRPLGLAIDCQQRLYICEAGAGLVDLIDLPGARLVTKIALGCGRPADAAPDCGRVIVLHRQPDGLCYLDGRRGPRPGPRLVAPRCYPVMEPIRVCAGPFVLWRQPGGPDAFVARPDGTIVAEVPGACAIATAPDGTVIVARSPGRSFRRFTPDAGGWTELEPLAAPRFDGGAVAVAPNGRTVFTTVAGLGWTAGSSAVHASQGTVVSYRFDSEQYRTRWGRVFVDTCQPASTTITIRFLTSDSDEVPDPIPASPPDRGSVPVPHPEATPPLPSALQLDAAGEPMPLFRRPNGREQPWLQIASDDPYQTYETAVQAPPGRYLWLELTLTGNAQVSPRVRAIRIERPGHPLLQTLPKAWSRDDSDADFLQRFLGAPEGVLYDLQLRAAARAILVDPQSTPQEALTWLAGFAGLVLDSRWSDQARRTLVAEAYLLFRRRGTAAMLARIIEIYLGYPPVIIEQWQLRGLGGTILGLIPAGPQAPSIGGEARRTGTLGRFMVGGQSDGQDSYGGTAHRFCVLIPFPLSAEQREVVVSLLEQHRPAHTLYQVLQLEAGMRLGDRLRISLTSFVGPGRQWSRATERSGIGTMPGRPAVGSRLDGNAAVGKVQIG